MMPLIRFSSPRPRGFTMIELMVGVAIGMLGILIIMETVVVNDRYKRSTVGASDAQTNGALALYTVERDARMAGYSMASSPLLSCGAIQWYWDTPPLGPVYSAPANPTSPLPSLTMAPIVIGDGGVDGGGRTLPDTITITWANPADRVLPGKLSKTMPSPSAELELEEVNGFFQNEMVVLQEPGQPCTMMQLTQVQGSPAKLQHNPGGSAPYNPPGGTSLFPAFHKDALVYVMGRPEVHRYEIASQNLQHTRYFTAASSSSLPLFNATPEVLYDSVVNLQAQYGKDTVNAIPSTVDTWNNTTPITAADWKQVLAVRLAVLARSNDYIKPATPGGACTATTTANAPTWVGGNFSVPDGLPSCYKYRVFETVVPLRNMIWGAAS